jgi:hypothetical protein
LAAKILVDLRRRPHVVVLDVFRAVLVLFAERLGSLNALEEVLRRRGRPLVRPGFISADTVGYSYARLEPEGLRRILEDLCKTARRNKSLQRRNPRLPWTIAIDGHELFSSYKRCCPECSERAVKTEGGEKTQFFHRVATAQIVMAEPPMCVDAELVRKAEGEQVAARRLIARAMAAFPFVRVFTMDALYLEAPALRALVAADRVAVVTLKQEARALFQEAQRLIALVPATETTLDGDRLETWDIPDIRCWEGMDDIPIRVVRTIRHRKIRERIAGKIVERVEKQDWMWAVAGPSGDLSATDIHLLGHGRWDIENRGYREMDLFFGLDHCFKHSPQAIINFALTLFIARVLTELFLTRNLKLPCRRDMTLAGLARMLIEQAPKQGDGFIWSTG